MRQSSLAAVACARMRPPRGMGRRRDGGRWRRPRQGLNRATTETFFVSVTVQAPCPEQAPLQLRKRPPVGVSVTFVPAGKLAPQAPAVQ